ncbi:MAG: hypothetical protein H0X37_02550 [Herpetosiphonaceae bacterium]|nr:hypothetical protein [Herpetosiphonaceae bacterium]
MQQLDVPVQAVLERGTLPPLLVIHLHDQFALLDLQTHRRVLLALPPHWNVSTFLLSSDHRHLAFEAEPNESADGGKVASNLYLADTQTGVLRVLLDGNQLLHDPHFDYAVGATIEPIAWQAQQLYTHIQESSSSYFWRIDTAQAHPVPDQFLVLGETGPWAIAPMGKVMVWSKLLWSKEVGKESLAHLLALDTNTDQPIERMQGAVWAPDGLTLAYTRPTSSGACCDLVLYDLRSQQAPRVQIDSPVRTQARDLTWAPDGHHLAVVTSTGTVIVVARGGTVVGTAPAPPIVDAVRLTNAGAVVLVLRVGEQSSLRTMTWSPPAQVRTDDTSLPSANDATAVYSLVYAPQ